MGKVIRVTVERPHTRPFEVEVVDGPTAAQVLDRIRRSPHGLARWVSARDRFFLAAADILHPELMAVPRSLGLVYSAIRISVWKPVPESGPETVFPHRGRMSRQGTPTAPCAPEGAGP